MAEKKADILESLKEQLRKKQADISVFNDLLDDYMTLYEVKKKLKTDIKKRGVTFETTSASGKATIIKQNQYSTDIRSRKRIDQKTTMKQQPGISKPCTMMYLILQHARSGFRHRS